MAIPVQSDKTNASSRSQLITLLLSPSELSTQPLLLSQLRDIINEAYKGTHFKLEKDTGVEPHSIFPGFRLDDAFQLIRELPEDSRLAIMFDNEEQEEEEEGISSRESSYIPEDSAAGHDQDDDSATTITGSSTRKVKDGENLVTNGTGELLRQKAQNKKVVAVASIKKWQGPVMYKYYRSLTSSNKPLPIGSQYPPREILDDTSRIPDKTQEEYWDWEIATCACVEDRKYRGMGIVSRLTGMLIDELKEKRMEYLNSHTSTSKSIIESPEKQESDTIPPQMDSTSNTPLKTSPNIRLWVSALGGSYNVQYWQKRGFTIQGNGPDTAPPGVWGNAKDVQIWTLNKVLDD